MSFLKGLVNIINVVDKATNDEFEVTREGRRFKILVHGRFHHPSEPWVYDVTATDVITGTSEKIRHFDRKEDGVNEATNAVLHALREKGVVGGVPMVTTEDRGQIALASRSEGINQALLKMLAKQGFMSEPNPPAPHEPRSPPPAYQHEPRSPPPAYQIIQSTSPNQPSETACPQVNPVSSQTSQKVPLTAHQVGGAPAVFQYGIEPDVDGLYTSVLIPPAHPDQALLDPRSTYVTWESPRKGLVYILNNSHFPYLPDRSKLRRGSDVDLQNVKHVFSQLGFEPLVHQNLSRVEILSTLDETVNRINAEGDAHSSFCLFFMSHGNWEGVSGTDARPADHRIVTRDEIKAKLTGRRCKALLGKPKLIFIQACRGNAFTRNADELDAIGKSTTEVQDEEPPFEMDYVSATQPLRSKEQPFEVDFVPRVTPTPSPTIELDSLDSPFGTVDLDVDGGGELPNNSDIFVANATSNGYYSIRMRREGSWFIQAISEVFLAHAHEDDLNELMRKVTCLVTESYRSQFSDEVTNRPFEVRQTPAYECQGMRRRFYFLPKYP
eukprot:XP_011668136.1 PREDICTED: cell death protein 3 [Strongylocentrotus purpuratus]